MADGRALAQKRTIMGHPGGSAPHAESHISWTGAAIIAATAPTAACEVRTRRSEKGEADSAKGSVAVQSVFERASRHGYQYPVARWTEGGIDGEHGQHGSLRAAKRGQKLLHRRRRDEAYKREANLDGFSLHGG